MGWVKVGMTELLCWSEERKFVSKAFMAVPRSSALGVESVSLIVCILAGEGGERMVWESVKR